MDAKEIKNKLKNARESIRKKEFKEALKQCKAVLSEDSNHYMALVLIGVAAEGLEQFDQALKAYKRAVAADDSQLLGWQGLSGYYEKNPSPEYRADQVDVYIKLVELHSGDKDKKAETGGKLATIVGQRDIDPAKADKIADLLTDCIGDTADLTKKIQLQKSLLAMLCVGSKGHSEDQVLQLSKEVLDNISDWDTDTEKIMENYLIILVKRGDSTVLETCTDLHQRFPNSLSATECVVLCHLDRCMDHEKPVCTEEFQALVGSLQTLSQDTSSPVLTAARGYVSLCNRDWTAAIDMFKHASSQSSKLVCVYFYEAVVCLSRHQNEDAVKFCQSGLKALQKKDRQLTVSSTEAAKSLNLLRVQALCELGDSVSLKVAMETAENELDNSSERVQVLKGLLHLKLGDVDNAKLFAVGESVQKLVLDGLIAEHEGDLPLAVSRYQSAVEAEPETANHSVRLVRCLWGIPDRRKECFTTLLKTAKLDPYNSDTFLYLGHHYSQEVGDKTRARKCYQKAFDLDPNSDTAGEALCDMLNEEGEEELAHTILVDVTSKASAGSAKWAWLRLGLYQVKHEDPSVAVASFQSALRSDPKNNHVWECLGEAYLARGSYTASLKAFTKASELDPESVYSLFQMAAIKQTLGSYREAIDEYKLILDKSPNYVPALKGLGETHLLVAKTLLNRYFHGRARDMSEMALSSLFRAASHRPDLSCLWKLLGDACTILHVLPAEGFRFEKPDKTILSKTETLELGGRCYVKALKILPECSSLWHDLGIGYLHQSQCSSGDAAISLVDKAEQAIKKAIQLEPSNHRHWTALGFVACAEGCFKPALAQHCFIKSIQAESNNVVAWTNLAALYLKHDNIKLAHEAFKVAQSLEPSYVACWIGQAIVAEVVGHEDAMDLFRHTTELGNHLESAIGYGHWVCSMLQNKDRQHSSMYTYAIEQMAAIPAASDVLARYTDRVKTNAVAYNLHGLLLERQGLYATAAGQLKCAVDLLERDGSHAVEMHQQVLCNYARVLCKKGDYPASVAVFDKVAAIDSFQDKCQMGLALYKVGDLDRSYQVYGKAFEVAPSEGDKSNVLSAIAMVWYKFGDRDKTKTTLFQSSQMSEFSLAGLKALCALGVIQSDVTLATAALQELFKLGDSGGHVPDVTLLAISLYILQSDMTEVKRYIQRLLHKNPDQPQLWHLLSEVLLRYFPHQGIAMAASSRCALELEKMCGNWRQELTIAALAQISAGYHGNTISSSKALYAAQRAVHLYPDRVQTWCCLVSALHAESVMTADTERRRSMFNQEYKLIGHILSHGNLSLELRLWCHKQRTICCLHGNQQTEAVECLEAMLTDCSNMPESKQFFEVFRLTMQDDAKLLLPLAESQGNAYVWQGKLWPNRSYGTTVQNPIRQFLQELSDLGIHCLQGNVKIRLHEIVIDLYLKAGLLEEVKSVVQKASPSCGQVRHVALVKLAHLILQRILAGGEGSEDLQPVFDDTVSQILSTDPQCTVIFLMQGILNFTSNARLSKHKMKCVLDTALTGRGSHEVSLARQALIYLLHSDAKNTELLETVVQEARELEDTASIHYYNSLLQQSP